MTSGGFSWFLFASGDFRSSLVLVSTERFNVDFDLICYLISFCAKL